MKDLSFSQRIIFFILIVLTLAVYGRVVSYPFINLDDNFFIVNNPHLKHGFSLESLRWVFAGDLFYDSVNLDYWQPMTALSRVADVWLFDFWAGGHHLVNLILHLVNIFLLFTVLFRISRHFWNSILVTAIFALHPMQAEAVIWVTARKDLLSGFFILLSADQWTRFLRKNSERSLHFSVLFYALSLLSKPNFLLVPGLLFFAAGGKIQKRIYLSFIACGLLFLFAVRMSGTGELERMLSYEWYMRSLAHFGFYLVKLFFPIGLGFYKPLDGSEILIWSGVGGACLTIVISALMVSVRKSERFIASALIFFFLTLATSIQIKMADRVLYLPQVGIWTALAWFFLKQFPKQIVSAGAVLILALYTFLSFRQAGYWKDTKTLFSHSENLNGSNYIAKNVLAVEYEKEGDLNLATRAYSEAIEANPFYLESYLNLGSFLMRHAQVEQALDYYKKALLLNPKISETHNFLGNAYLQLNEFDLAEQAFQAALKLSPDHVQALNNLANAVMRKGRWADAIRYYEEAIRIDPEAAEPHNNLGVLYEFLERYEDALREYKEVLRVSPKSAEVYSRIARMLERWGKPNEAQFYYQKGAEVNTH